MKNIPHQINQIPRLAQGLGVFASLLKTGKDIENDGTLGDALAIAGVYTFRSQRGTIQQMLAKEHTKPRGSQGTRTCARDLRRFYRLLGFLDNHALTADAQRLVDLQADPLGLEARAIWTTSLNSMLLTEAGNTSHPYRILLRLVGECPGINRSLLGLCLEARDDSEVEFQRVRRLALLQADPNKVWKKLNVSPHMARNSVKILPALAQQIGDILEADYGFHLGQASFIMTEDEPVYALASRAKTRRRPYDPGRRMATADLEERRKSVRIYDPDLIGERFTAHEACLRRFSELIPKPHEQYEGDYDLLVVAPKQALVIEVKTIRDDEAKQLRLALGQILYYEHILVRPMYPDHNIRLLIVTDSRPHEDLVRLLEKYQIGVVWLPSQNDLAGRSTLASGYLNQFLR